MRRNPILNLLATTWKYSANNRKSVVIFVALSFIANTVQLLEPVVVSRVFNSVQFDVGDPGLLRFIIINLAYIVLITVTFWSFHGISRVIESKNAFLVRKNYKKQMFDKVLELSTEWHKNHHSGDTIDKINKASEAIYSFSSKIFIIITNFVRLFGSITALMFFDAKASIIAIVSTITVLFLLIKFDNKLRDGYKQIFRYENHLASAIHDYISNIITITTLRLKGRVSKEIDTRSMLSFEPFMNNNVLTEIKWFTASILLSLTIAGVLIQNAYFQFSTTGVVILGTLFALFQYTRRLGDVFFDFALRYNEWVQQDTAVKAAEIINDEYKLLAVREKHKLPANWDRLEIKNLSFTYDKHTKEQDIRIHISNINLAIENRQKIAFIGESGSGKSTLLALLRGLYHTDEALVICDGNRLPHGLAHFHEHVTLIPQDPEIFNSTVEDNITMETHVSVKDLNEAIELAQFKHVLTRLPEGLKTNVMEKGVSLSGGEKQRLALARGLLAARSSDMLFMDEPTSSVDTANELLIYENIFKKYKDKTIISSIHRLHLLKFFDYIYYFSHGKVIAEGTITALLKNPKFKTLWENYNKDIKKRK